MMPTPIRLPSSCSLVSLWIKVLLGLSGMRAENFHAAGLLRCASRDCLLTGGKMEGSFIIMSFRVDHIFISREHNYFGHYGKPAGETPIEELQEAEFVEGKGIQGDRFFGYKEDYKGQVTLFSSEVYEDVCRQFPEAGQLRGPEVFRRNVVVSGVDLNSLIGKEFEIQGVLFLGMSECTPCEWMDQAFCPGTESALKGRGGLRAKILRSGKIRVESPPAASEDAAE